MATRNNKHNLVSGVYDTLQSRPSHVASDKLNFSLAEKSTHM